MIIVDLDGCIADDRWRRHMIRPASVPIRERFHKYHLAGCRDHLCNADLVYSDDHLVVVVTSRPEWYRRLTHQWLLDWEIMPRAIIMRRDDDYRPSVEVKRDAALRLIEEHGLNGIECAYDSREDIVEMYRELGIRAELAGYPEDDEMEVA